mgnify:CR=1 FL=1
MAGHWLGYHRGLAVGWTIGWASGWAAVAELLRQGTRTPAEVSLPPARGLRLIPGGKAGRTLTGRNTHGLRHLATRPERKFGWA